MSDTLSPILFLAALNARVADAGAAVRALPGRAPGVSGTRGTSSVEETLALVQYAGFWGHFSRTVRGSTWPFARGRGLDSIEALLDVSVAMKLIRVHAEPGALALRAADRGLRCGAFVSDRLRGRYDEVAIVTRCLGRTALPGSLAMPCELLVAERRADGATRHVYVERTLDAARGDRFVHWWEWPRDGAMRETRGVRALVELRGAA